MHFLTNSQPVTQMPSHDPKNRAKRDAHDRRKAERLLQTPLMQDAFEALRLMEAKGFDIAKLTGVQPLLIPSDRSPHSGRSVKSSRDNATHKELCQMLCFLHAQQKQGILTDEELAAVLALGQTTPDDSLGAAPWRTSA